MRTAALWSEWADEDELDDFADDASPGGAAVETLPAQFPVSRLNVKVELWLDGDWVDLIAGGYVYTRDPIVITYGEPNEGSGVDTGRCTMTINNRDGRFSPRNPRSPYFGVLGRNTPLRVTIFDVGPAHDSVARFYGEVSEWPPRWTTGGQDVWVPIEANGIMRRLGQGQAALRSTPVRYLPDTAPIAYWPLEEGPLSTAGTPLAGTSTMVPFVGTHPSGAVVSVPQWGQGELAPWLAPTVVLSASSGLTILWGRVSMSTVFTTTWTVDWVYIGATGAPSTTVDVNPSYLGGATGWPQVTFDPPNRQVSVAMNPTDAEVLTTVTSLFDGYTHHIRWTVSQSGTKAAWVVYVDGTSVNSGTTATDQTVIQIDTVALVSNATGGTDAARGHLAVWTTPPALTDAVDAALGYAGETTAERMTRLCAEEDVPFFLVNASGSATRVCGPQYLATLLELLRDAAAVDGGLLYEPRDALGLSYRPLRDMYNQDPALALDYDASEVAPPVEPTDDDQHTRNDVTVTRRFGGSSQYVQTSGDLSTQQPPDGVGRYDTTVEIGLNSDDDTANQASWLVHLGTIDEARFPRIVVNQARLGADGKTSLLAGAAQLSLGSRATIDNPPDWLPPRFIDQLARGYTETLEPYGWTIAFNCAPAAPYRIATLESSNPLYTARLQTDGSTLVGDYDAVATTLTVASTGTRWIETAVSPSSFPFDVEVQGMRLTVTAIVGSSSPQTFTVSRSVDGFDVALRDGAQVRLWNRTYIGL